MLFAQLAARLPAFATTFAGELQCDLHRSDGSTTSWTIESGPGRAIARRGPAKRPALTARLSVADMIRIAAGELDPGRAVLEGRLDFAGDFGVMNRLMSIFARAGLELAAGAAQRPVVAREQGARDRGRVVDRRARKTGADADPRDADRAQPLRATGHPRAAAR